MTETSGRGIQLRRGRWLELADLRDSFSLRPDGAWAVSEQYDFLGDTYDRIESAVRWLLETAAPQTISIFDLSRLEGIDALKLADAIRWGIVQASTMRRRDRRRWSPRTPPYFYGERFIALIWTAQTESERHLRLAFALAWNRLDIYNPSERIILPVISEKGVRRIGELPPSLGGPRLGALIENRLLTYHDLAVDPGQPGHDAKQLGRLLLRLEKIGLVVPRHYATREDIARLELTGTHARFGRPRHWESVLAATAELFTSVDDDA